MITIHPSNNLANSGVIPSVLRSSKKKKSLPEKLCIVCNKTLPLGRHPARKYHEECKPSNIESLSYNNIKNYTLLRKIFRKE